MRRSPKREIAGFAIALISPPVVLALRAFLDVEVSRIILVVPMLLSSWYGGPRPAALAGVLGVACSIGLGIVGGSLASDPAATTFEVSLLAGLGLIAFGMARDITPRVLAFRRADEQAKLLDLAHVLVREREGRIVYWNRGAEQLYGWTCREALGQISHELLRTGFPAPLDGILAEVDDRGRWAGELTHHRKDGSRVVVSSLWVLVRGGDGHSDRILEVNNDITALKRSEQALEDLNATLETCVRARTEDLEARTRELAASEAALRHQKDLFGLIIDSMSEGVMVSDRAGTIVLCNAAARRIHAFDVGQQLLNSSDRLQLFSDEGTTLIPMDQWPVSRALRGEEPDEMEIFAREAGAEGKFTRASARPLKGDDGSIRGTVLVFRDVNDVRRARVELEASQRRFQAFMDNSPAVAWMKDQDGRITYVNRAAAGMMSPGRSRVVGRNEAEFCRPIAGEYPWDDRRILDSGVAEQRIEVIEPGDRGRRTLLNVRFPFVDASGRRLIGVVGVDITDRRTAEEAVRESEARLRHILENAPALVYIKDLDRRYRYVNRRCAELWDTRAADWIGRTADEIMPSVTSQQFRDNDNLVIETRMTRTVEETAIDPGGSAHVFLSTQFPLTGTGGAIDSICGISLEITDRVRAEHALRDSEERFRRFMDNAPAVAWIKDEAGRHVYRNNRFTEVVNSPRDDWLGMTDFDLWPEAAAKVFRANDLQVLEEDAPIEFEEPLYVEGRPPTYWLTSKFPIVLPGNRRCVAGIAIDITDRRRAELELARSEQRFRGAFESASIGMAISDDRGRFKYVNPSLAAFLGYAESELVGLDFHHLTHPDDLPQEVMLYERLSGGEIDSFRRRKRFLHRSGSVVWGALNISSVRDPQGGLIELVVLVQNINDQVHAEEDRRRSEAIIRSLFDGTPMQMGVVKLEGDDIIHVTDNRAAAEAFGRNPEDMAGKDAGALGVPEDRLRIWLEAYRRCDETGEPVRFEYPFRDPGNHGQRWLSATVAPVRPDGQLTTMYSYVAEEVTDRKRREQELERLVDILERTPDIVAMRTEDGRLSYLNTAGRQWTELPAGPVPNVFDPRCFHSERSWRQFIEVGIPCALRDGCWQGEATLLTPDGRDCPFLQTVIAHRGGDGEGRQISSILRDISSQRRFEQDLRSARDEAIRANQLKSAFLANMSHEIRTPMNAILGMTDVMLGRSPSSETREDLEIIKKSADNLLVIINQILDLSKIEANLFELERVPFRIGDVIAGVGGTLRHQARASGLGFEVDPGPDDSPRLLGDPVSLRQVLLNLVGNAIKFTEQGQVTLSVVREELENRRHRVRFTVRDTGIGIPPDKRKVIFDSFRQADSSTTRKYGGTGLGLSISRRLIELMGGTLEVESEEGRGSTFTFAINWQAAAPDATDPSRPAPHMPSLSPSTPEAPGPPVHLSILLVDDNALNRRVGTLLLRRMGHEVAEATSGPDAIAGYASRSYDLVLMDIEMPDMDGVEAARRIRALQDQQGRRIPIICLTAHAMKGDEERFLRSGMDGYLAKPISEAALRRVIDRLADPPRTQSDDAEIP